MRKNNVTLKNIRDFNENDTIYISRNIRGYQIIYFCQFSKYTNGVVYGKALSAEPNHAMHVSDQGKEIKARLKSCFLFGKQGNDEMEFCQWFKSNGTIKEANNEN